MLKLLKPQQPPPVVVNLEGSQGTWSYRARVNMTAKNETDYGTLTSAIRFQADGDGSAVADVGIDRALISLAGLRVGYTDQYWATNHGYGTAGPIRDDPSGFDQAIILDYTFAADAFAFTIGLQNEQADSNDDTDGNPGYFGAENPDIYAGFNVSGSWGSFAATLGHNTDNETTAGRVSLSLTVVDGLEIKGLYAGKFDEDEDNNFVAENWEYGIGFNYQATEDFNVYVSHFDADSDDAAGTVVGSNWAFADGIRVQSEITFLETDQKDFRTRVVRSF